MDDNSLLDHQEVTLVPNNLEPPNAFGCNLIRRLGIGPSNDGAEAASSSSTINKVTAN